MPPAATSSRATVQVYPVWMRLIALVWFLTWFPVYWRYWGFANFIHLCDVAVILTCIGMWTNNRLLISSQALGALLVDAVWALDAAWIVFLHRQLLPGNEYLLDPSYPLWVRALSFFHVCMPVLLLWGLFRAGYDRRGWALQSAIALPAFVIARFTSSEKNINFAFTDPFIHRQWGPAPAHILISWLFMVFVVYWPTHLLLKRFFRPAA